MVNGRKLTCQETEELLPEYALGVLDASEAADVARHVHACSQHTESLNRYEAVGDGLCLSVPMMDPPAKLKARLMAKVTPPARASRPVDRVARFGWAAAAIAAALAIAFGAWGLSLQRQINSQAAARNNLVALSTQPDAHMVALETEPAGGSAKGVIIYTASQAAVWAVGLPELEGDQVYQCWWLDGDGRRVSGGAFKAEGGIGVWLMPLPDDAENYHAIGITLEPNDHSTQPLGPKVMGGDF